jgi:hypothetical protein
MEVGIVPIPIFLMEDRHIPAFSPNPESIEGSREKETRPPSPLAGEGGVRGVLSFFLL